MILVKLLVYSDKQGTSGFTSNTLLIRIPQILNRFNKNKVVYKCIRNTEWCYSTVTCKVLLHWPQCKLGQ